MWELLFYRTWRLGAQVAKDSELRNETNYEYVLLAVGSHISFNTASAKDRKSD